MCHIQYLSTVYVQDCQLSQKEDVQRVDCDCETHDCLFEMKELCSNNNIMNLKWLSIYLGVTKHHPPLIYLTW